MANTGSRSNNALISSGPLQPYASAPVYDDDPPPYPFHEILHIGWSPKMAVINHNAVPSTHLTMSIPTVQNAMINNDRLTNSTSVTPNNCTRISDNSTSLNGPVRSQVQRTRNIRQRQNNRSSSTHCNPCYIVSPFILVLVVIVLMVILVLRLTVKSIRNYEE